MTHGRAIWNTRDGTTDPSQRGLKDVPAVGGFFGLDWPAYGWKMAKALAEGGDALRGDRAPDNNADTIALFGSGTFTHHRPMQYSANSSTKFAS
jgi:hypothetical protein